MNIVDDNDIEETVEKLSSLSKKLNDNNKNPDEPSSTAIEDQEILKLEKHFEPSFDRLGANRLQNILEMDLPRPKALLGSHHGYDMSQGSVAGELQLFNNILFFFRRCCCYCCYCLHWIFVSFISHWSVENARITTSTTISPQS